MAEITHKEIVCDRCGITILPIFNEEQYDKDRMKHSVVIWNEYVDLCPTCAILELRHLVAGMPEDKQKHMLRMIKDMGNN